MGGETIHAFVRALGPRGSSLYDKLTVISVNTVEEMTTRVKSYNDLENTKESGKEAHEGK